ncbi:MAG TPA: YceI family protein [Burkholderiaceae bacterium]|nr:YceI family protein [Burkholderiaceae bacterium]
MNARRFLLAAMLLVSASAALAQTIDAARSSVSATFKQMGVPVEGRFRKVGGQVVYDPANPAAAQAKLDVDIASFDLGDPQYNREVQQKEWFDAARFPAASFASTSVKAVGAAKLEVGGRLTIKGRSVDVHVPLSLRSENGATVFEGSVPIRRLAFTIGEGEWKDTALLADEVVVKFHLVVPAGK